MKKVYVFLSILISITSCSTKEKTPQKKVPSRDITSYLVYENDLRSDEIKSAEIENVLFDAYGATFLGNEQAPSFIKIPFSSLNLQKPFNISFDFEVFEDDNNTPKALVALIDKFSSPSRAPLIIYFPWKRVSGAFGRQLLWAEKYNLKRGYSSRFFDSFQLSPNTTYNLSMNYAQGRMEFYIDNELYMIFDGIKQHDLTHEHILLGALPQKEGYKYFLNGRIANLKIFNTALTEAEIHSNL